MNFISWLSLTKGKPTLSRDSANDAGDEAEILESFLR